MLCIPKADAMHPQAAFCEIHPAKSGPQYSLNMYTIKFPTTISMETIAVTQLGLI
jgi:hypothetical protein